VKSWTLLIISIANIAHAESLCPPLKAMTDFRYHKSANAMDYYQSTRHPIVAVISCSQRITSTPEQYLQKHNGSVQKISSNKYLLKISQAKQSVFTFFEFDDSVYQYSFAASSDQQPHLDNLEKSILNEFIKK
jgi:hypothetical protein